MLRTIAILLSLLHPAGAVFSADFSFGKLVEDGRDEKPHRAAVNQILVEEMSTRAYPYGEGEDAVGEDDKPRRPPSTFLRWVEVEVARQWEGARDICNRSKAGRSREQDAAMTRWAVQAGGTDSGFRSWLGNQRGPNMAKAVIDDIMEIATHFLPSRAHEEVEVVAYQAAWACQQELLFSVGGKAAFQDLTISAECEIKLDSVRGVTVVLRRVFQERSNKGINKNSWRKMCAVIDVTSPFVWTTDGKAVVKTKTIWKMTSSKDVETGFGDDRPNDKQEKQFYMDCYPRTTLDISMHCDTLLNSE